MRQPDFSALWNSSIIHRRQYQSTFSIAAASESTGSVDSSSHSTSSSAFQARTHQARSGFRPSLRLRAGSTIASMDGIASAIADAVERQGSATNEIARTIDDAASGTKEVFDTISEVTTSIRATDQAAREVLVAVETMRSEATSLRAEIDRFLAGIREA